MKTTIIPNLKKSGAVILSVLLVITASCDNMKSKSGDSQKGLNDAQVKVSPPSMDISAAAFLGELDAVKQHIAAGTDLNVKDPVGGSTPLITVCVFGRTEVALELINAGADLNAQNNDGSTPLHCAALFCHKEILESLLAKGADKNIKNNVGEIPAASVTGPFSEMKPIYEFLEKELGPLGLKLDYEQIEKTRPEIAELLK